MRCAAFPVAAAALALATGSAPAIVGPSQEGGALAAGTVMVLNHVGHVAAFCSGIVVAADAVLTAAHCVPKRAALKVHYRDGPTPVLLDVAAVVRHPGYRSDAIRTRQRSVDLALLRMAAPLPARFRPVVLSTQAGTVVGAPFRLGGFGLQHEGEAGSSGTLRVTDVAAQSPLSGLLLWAHDAAGAGRGACTGDSGGPVLDGAGQVVGVIAWSAGTGASQCGALTQAVWVGPQRDWIAGVLARWAETPR